MIYEFQGDAVEMALTGCCDIFVHQINCQGYMNKGIGQQIRMFMPDHFRQYVDHTRWMNNAGNPLLGTCFYNMEGIVGERELWVAGIYGQEHIGQFEGLDISGRYCGPEEGHTNVPAFRRGLTELIIHSQTFMRGNKHIQMIFPKNIGLGLAGGTGGYRDRTAGELQNVFQEIHQQANEGPIRYDFLMVDNGQ